MSTKLCPLTTLRPKKKQTKKNHIYGEWRIKKYDKHIQRQTKGTGAWNTKTMCNLHTEESLNFFVLLLMECFGFCNGLRAQRCCSQFSVLYERINDTNKHLCIPLLLLLYTLKASVVREGMRPVESISGTVFGVCVFFFISSVQSDGSRNFWCRKHFVLIAPVEIPNASDKRMTRNS